MDTTPIWLIAIFAILAVLVWIALEIRHSNKGGGSHYHVTNNARIYKETRDTLDALDFAAMTPAERVNHEVKQRTRLAREQRYNDTPIHKENK